MLATKRSLVCVVCALTLSVTGCYRPIGPQSVARDRHLYAASLSDSWKEQTLLNIDRPQLTPADIEKLKTAERNNRASE